MRIMMIAYQEIRDHSSTVANWERIMYHHPYKILFD